MPEFWGSGVWMPLLASLRRLENGTVHPELEDLKKMAQTMAASLYRSLPKP